MKLFCISPLRAKNVILINVPFKIYGKSRWLYQNISIFTISMNIFLLKAVSITQRIFMKIEVGNEKYHFLPSNPSTKRI